MKMPAASLLLSFPLSCVLFLAGCAATDAAPAASSGAASPAAVDSASPAAVDSSKDLLYGRYADTAALPAFTGAVERVCTFDDRTLTLEGVIHNELESIVYQTCYAAASADFKAYAELIGENEALQISLANEEKQFHAGMYHQDVTLHGLRTLEAAALDGVSAAYRESVLEQLLAFDLTQYAIVEADLSWISSEAALRAGPQLADGRYLRYFLLGSKDGAAEFKIYELYWDGFLPSGAAPAPEPAAEAMVRVADYIPGIAVSLRYAAEDNFTGQKIYDFTDAYLRYGTVVKLAAAQDALAQQGYSLLIWDAFRPTAAQFQLWEACPDPIYVADPEKGFSSHSRGNTVDVTLTAADGSPVEMPTDFDDFTALADRDYHDVCAASAANAQRLEDALTACGFQPYSGEWWHFSDTDSYPVEEVFAPPAAP